ncbi:hypothetical protein, partial [Pseudomonas sp. 2822-17]|uniref:hypothetical protein n=1 Tax=Pseudomonas sp. 2822-17 TaxID=1712678 RepID=UPI001C441019
SRFPTANEPYVQARSHSKSSDRFAAFVEAYEWYPKDSRIIKGINDGAIGILNWSIGEHRRERYDTAIDRYEYILSAPVLDKSIKEETNELLVYA